MVAAIRATCGWLLIYRIAVSVLIVNILWGRVGNRPFWDTVQIARTHLSRPQARVSRTALESSSSVRRVGRWASMGVVIVRWRLRGVGVVRHHT
jgi:hypothetical protein